MESTVDWEASLSGRLQEVRDFEHDAGADLLNLLHPPFPSHSCLQRPPSSHAMSS